MESESKIRGRGFFILNLFLCRIFTHIPTSFTRGCATGAPLASALWGTVLFVLIATLLFLHKKSGGITLTDIAERIFGRFGRLILSVFLLAYLLASSAFTLRELSMLVGLISFPTAPLWFIGGFFLIGMLYGAFCSESAVLRCHNVAVPFIMVATLVVLVSVAFYSLPENLAPILGTGATDTLRTAVSNLFLCADIILLFLIEPGHNSHSIRKTLFASGIGILLWVAVVSLFTATNSYPESLLVRFPIFRLLKTVWYGRFFQRLDAFYMLSITTSGLLSLSLTIHIASNLLKGFFHCKKERRLNIFLVSVVSILVYVSACLTDHLTDSILRQWFIISAITLIALTGFVLVTGSIFGKRGE